MSILDIMTDAEVEELQRKALYVETAEFYSCIIQVLWEHCPHLDADAVKAKAKELYHSGTVDHPYEVACREALPVIDQYDE